MWGRHSRQAGTQGPPPLVHPEPPTSTRPPAHLKVRSPILTKSRRGHVCSLHCTRSGHDMVYRMGRRMSGQPSCASTLLSAVSTME